MRGGTVLDGAMLNGSMLKGTVLKRVGLRIAWLPLLMLLLATPATLAHHGWDWVSDDWVILTGEVQAFRSGNPHSELTLMVESETWLVELGNL